jgi:hypothetical protein
VLDEESKALLDAQSWTQKTCPGYTFTPFFYKLPHSKPQPGTKTMKTSFLALLLFVTPIALATPVQQFGPIRVLTLSGSYKEMGKEYGQTLKTSLQEELTILKRYYAERGVKREALVKQANLLYDRFPAHYQQFIQAEAESSGLSLDDVKILNAMETLIGLLTGNQQTACAFLFIPANETKANAAMMGRNYDYPAPFNLLAKYLTITILQPEHSVPTAFISLAGEIYCPTCVNAKGVFMELNNGMYSGGTFVSTKRQSMLTSMLDTLLLSDSLAMAEEKMKKKQTDFSLIVNVADKSKTTSFEYSSVLGMRTFYPSNDTIFASTNFYLSPSWGKEVPPPMDAATWQGVTRRHNLLELAASQHQFDVKKLEKLMDKTIKTGGAVWDFTIYQLIFDESDLSLYAKILPESSQWIHVPLGQLFKQLENA